MNATEWAAAVIVFYVIAWWCLRHPDWGYYYFGAWTLVYVGLAAWAMAAGDWGGFWWTLAAAAASFLYWWTCRKRRKRKRATELAGYKARALREKIAAKQRETTQRRPVLSPAPEGQ